jgi:diketogulonate reductase-like aldo/keto reductase
LLTFGNLIAFVTGKRKSDQRTVLPANHSETGSKKMTLQLTVPAAAAGTFTIGGDLSVNRMAYGAMRITGPGVWGPPADKQAALATLRKAIELGVNLIDTADSYGPATSEELIAAVLYPYPAIW